MKKKFQRKPKQPKALWTRIKNKTFQEQRKQLHPESDASRGGSKARSESEALRMAIYRPIAEMFKKANPICKLQITCGKSQQFAPNPTEDVHHKRGRQGLLIFDIRHWLPVCRKCHSWIKDNPEKAKELGLDESHVNQ